ncbi:hypothetical protein [Noviherbaspirillum suwonense]|uniref:hypothetical protein n=1 Tax=Noviherbaspirillum suwonense TaxID=1224511 RepID=UPI0024B77691|nr:hypothetical protein [Noviherbaspirillum suwonense]
MKWYTYDMNRVLKTFLVWLLLAALPLQGFAAAVQASCGPAAHHDAAEITMQTESHHHEGDAPDSVTVVAAKSAGDSADIKHKGSLCSACAACCVGAVAPPSVPALISAYSSSLPEVISPSPLVTGFIPAGLERPPKRITA